MSRAPRRSSRRCAGSILRATTRRRSAGTRSTGTRRPSGSGSWPRSARPWSARASAGGAERSRVSPSPVTVVMPTRDRWLLATLAIESVLAQEVVDLELIVVDDGSAGEAFRPVEDPRLRVLRSERSQGVARARDRGLQAAAHPWVAFLDDDDLWSPRHLGLTLEAAAEDGGAEWAYVAQIVIDGASRPRYVRGAPSAEGMYARLVRRNT